MFDKISCEITAFSQTEITCTLAYTKYAGSFKPKVHIYGLGYMLYDSVSDDETDIVISSWTPTEGSTEGLTEVTVTGTGYPYVSLPGFTIKVGDLEIKDFKFISSTTISFFTPR